MMLSQNSQVRQLTDSPSGPASMRAALALMSIAIVFVTFAVAGPRSALLMLIGLGFGLVLEGLRFGFAGPWRQMLVNAGSGNLVALLALPGFIVGSFVGSLHLAWLTALGSLPVMSLQGLFGAGPGLWLTLFGLLLLATAAIARAMPGKRLLAARLWWAAVLIAALAVLNLIIAGQSWGVVYGLGLWGAKTAQLAGMDVAATGFWAAAGNAERLQQNLLTDVMSLTNIGLIVGAFIVMQWRRTARKAETSEQVRLPGHLLWAVMLVAIALVLTLLLIDYRVSVPVNPFAAPPPAAYGSGLAPSGGHCTQL